MPSKQEDVDALERILFRLASTSDERIVHVLDKLLPEILKLFPPSITNPLDQTLTDKVIEKK
jgi:hypothetical protein